MASLTGNTEVRTTADVTINSDDSLNDDATLKIAMAANEVWLFEALLLYNSAAAADIKFAFTVPAGASLSWLLTFISDGTVSMALTQASGTSVDVLTDASAQAASVKAIVRNSSTAGDLQLQWAQRVSDAGDTKVLTDSYLLAAKEA